MNMVKGSLLMEVVRLIRANKNLKWEKHLNDEDMNLVQSKILPSSWYPLETYERMGHAIFMEVGKGDLKNAWQWGRFTIEELVTKSYKNLFQGLDVLGAFKKFVFFRKQFFKVESEDIALLDIEVKGPKEVMMIIQTPTEVADLMEPYAHQLSGSFERLVELFGGKTPKTEIMEKQWKGDKNTTIKVTWE